ncbi:MAG: PIN/TRAM domain-containing protein [Phycisphaerales bacterium]|nr:MAG: PIN/TRAM domain-containing protein [Phycisphaerales bacterium]
MLVVRLLFLVLLITIAMLTMASGDERPEDFNLYTAAAVFLTAVGIGVVVLVVDAMLPNKRLTSVVGVYVGICAGLLVALAIGALIDVVAQAWGLTGGQMDNWRGLFKVMIAIILCYLAVSFVLTTKDDFRLVIPYVEFAKQVRGVRPILLDTSVLIDGRVESLSSTGLIDAPTIVPQFVIEELQTLADSSERMKRTRGRRGLSILGKLRESPYLDLSIDEAAVSMGQSVDHALVDLAQSQNLRILTTDYNLAKVGQIQDVTVLNINDLANALKSQAIPGEEMSVEIIKRGEGPNQGVGYLPDGTMVVVENAADHVGDTLRIVVSNSLQTSAGKMIFGRRIGDPEPQEDPEDADQTDRPEGESSGRSRESSSGSVSRLSEAATKQPRSTDPPSRVKRSDGRRNPRR